MHIAFAQIASIEGDTKVNLERALEAIQAVGGNADLIIFPEMYLTGFPEPGAVAGRSIDPAGAEVTALIEASREYGCAIAIGFLERAEDAVFNMTVLITPEDGILLRYRKTHLWTDERDLIGAGDRLVCANWRGHRIGLLICYDIEFPEPARALAAMGCDLIVVTNGNMEPFGPVHRRAAAARAQDNQLFFAMTNRVGEGAGQMFAGESAVFDPYGECLVRCGHEEITESVTLDFSSIESARALYHYLDDRRIGLAGEQEEDDRQQAWKLSK